MAQWLGQFSGVTHLSKVQDAEALLARAVAVLHSLALGPTRDQKAKAAERLGRKLLAARLKRFKSRLVVVRDAQGGRATAHDASELNLSVRQLENARIGGLAAIRAEFGWD